MKCNTCNNCCNDCNPCKKKCCPEPCGCPTQIMSIDTLHSDTPAWLRFNMGGKSIDYDFTSVVKAAETDTSLSLDIPKRTLAYRAERHTDEYTSSELGSILHIADIGDVDITGVTDNSIFVYQKNSDCGEGCEGIDNSWVAWNANDHLENNVATVMGFDESGKPRTLKRPTNTAVQHLLGWDRSNKVSFFRPREAATPPVDSDSKKYRLYLDPSTGEIVYVKES